MMAKIAPLMLLLLAAGAAAACQTDADCGASEFCAPGVGGRGVSPCTEEKVCKARASLGESCTGDVFTALPCAAKECEQGLRCVLQHPIVGPGEIAGAQLTPLFGTCERGLEFTQPPRCLADVRECADGSFVSRDAAKNCAFAPCPVLRVCAADVRLCDDGQHVTRDPADDCRFPACPDTPPTQCSPGETSEVDCNVCACDTRGQWMCTEMACACRAGESKKKDCNDCVCVRGMWACTEKACATPAPEAKVCPADVKKCADGSYVSRVAAKKCEFAACPVATEPEPTPVPVKCIRALSEWEGCLATPDCCDSGLYCKKQSQWWASCRKAVQ